MQYKHHPVKNTRTDSIKDQRRTVEDTRIGKLRGRGAPLRIPHPTENPRTLLRLDILEKKEMLLP